MSTHSLDASGQRPLTTTTNDPARTAATVTAKQGDDVVIQLGSYTHVEIPIPDQAGLVELVVRRNVEKKAKLDDKGDYVRDESRHIVYEEGEVERWSLRFKAGAYVVGRTEPNESGFSSTPHSMIRVVNLDNDPNQPIFLAGEETVVKVLDFQRWASA